MLGCSTAHPARQPGSPHRPEPASVPSLLSMRGAGDRERLIVSHDVSQPAGNPRVFGAHHLACPRAELLRTRPQIDPPSPLRARTKTRRRRSQTNVMGTRTSQHGPIDPTGSRCQGRPKTGSPTPVDQHNNARAQVRGNTARITARRAAQSDPRSTGRITGWLRAQHSFCSRPARA